MKRLIALQKKILDENWKYICNKKYERFLISEKEGFVYVSENAKNIVKINKCMWFLDNSASPFYNPHLSISELADEDKTYGLDDGELTGVVKKGVEVMNESYNLIEIRNQKTGNNVYLNEKLLKYIPYEHTYIKCSSPKSLVYFIDKQLHVVVSVVCPVNYVNSFERV